MKEEEIKEEFIIFRRPESCVRNFLAQDCAGIYHKLQEINPEHIFALQKKELLEKIKLEKKGKGTHGYWFNFYCGYNAAVEDLESLKKQLK